SQAEVVLSQGRVEAQAELVLADRLLEPIALHRLLALLPGAQGGAGLGGRRQCGKKENAERGGDEAHGAASAGGGGGGEAKGGKDLPDRRRRGVGCSQTAGSPSLHTPGQSFFVWTPPGGRTPWPFVFVALSPRSWRAPSASFLSRATTSG